MNQLFAERFKSARIMQGLSLEKLAEKLPTRISKQSLHKYEKGEVFPDSEMLGWLSEALGVRPGFFLRETKVEFGKVEFRKIQKLPLKEQSRVIETTKEILSRYLELEEIVGVSTSFNNPLEGTKKISTPEEVEKAVKEIRKQWKIGSDPIANVIELLEDNQVKIIEIDADDEFDGLQTWVNSNIPVLVLNTAILKSADRKRFTALHEFGHLILPINHLPDKEREKLCNRFAGAMLFSEEAAYMELGEKRKRLSVQELGALKQYYGISIQALAYRAKDLGIISENQMRLFFLLINQMGWKVEEPIEYERTEKSNRFQQLLHRALAEELISMSKAAELSNKKLVDFRNETLLV